MAVIAGTYDLLLRTFGITSGKSSRVCLFVCCLRVLILGKRVSFFFINAFTRCSFVFIRIFILISSCIRVFIRLFACSFIYFAILSGFTKWRKGKADEVFCFGIETFVNFCGCFICTEEHIE